MAFRQDGGQGDQHHQQLLREQHRAYGSVPFNQQQEAHDGGNGQIFGKRLFEGVFRPLTRAVHTGHDRGRVPPFGPPVC